MTWLPTDFAHPLRIELTAGAHLRPIAASDVDIDMVTVHANQPMLWAMFGDDWQWPPTTMTREQDEEDLARHALEMVDHESFNYAVLNDDETVLYGCVYIDPLEVDPAPGAEVSWWASAQTPADVRDALDAFVPAWIAAVWPFRTVEYPFQERYLRARG